MLWIDSAQVRQIAMTRTWDEMRLAEELRDAFDSCPAMPVLRDFVAQAIEQVLAMTQRRADLLKSPEAALGPRISQLRDQVDRYGRFADKQELARLEVQLQAERPEFERVVERLLHERRVIERLISGENKLKAWTKFGAAPGIEGLMAVYQRRHEWTALDCSDMIRLYAAVTESKFDKDDPDNKYLRRSGFVGAADAALQDGARVGGVDVWAKPNRAREPSNKPLPAGVHVNMPAHVAAARGVAIARAESQGVAHAGIAGSLLADTSTIRSMDATFALPAGADISGTTADSVFFMKEVEDFYSHVPDSLGAHLGGLATVMQLLPLATMVSQGHHTLLESAIVLTMDSVDTGPAANAYNTAHAYSIGFYDTLLPYAIGTAEDPLVERIAGILDRWSALARNKHVVCFPDASGNWVGGLCDRESEFAELRRFARADLDLLMFFREYQGRSPNAAELGYFMSMRGCHTLAGLFHEHRA
ncbi:MAG: hypothetical protein HY855_22930 [Burkholderiales bacterium]|nr:hypothetical protein [Burkholderiales bacterium]